jgi:cytochrome c biogenesis protein CcmG, thiol:disulfide interchange protein DsbE
VQDRPRNSQLSEGVGQKMSRRIRATVLLGVVVVAAVLVGVALAGVLGGVLRSPDGFGNRWASQAPAGLSGRLPATARGPLPEVTLVGFAGHSDVVLTRYRGRPLVINLWATWCAPCVEEMPALQQVATATRGTVAFLGVNVADDPDAARAFVAKLGITYDLASDPHQDFARRVAAFGMPTTLLVDPQGTIVYRRTGPLDAAALRGLLADRLSIGPVAGR